METYSTYIVGDEDGTFTVFVGTGQFADGYEAYDRYATEAEADEAAYQLYERYELAA